MKAVWNDTVIAESSDTVVVEGNHYFPKEALVSDFFVPSAKTSFCPWKGTATYQSVVIDGKTNTDAAWCYSEPKEKAKEIAGRIAFWNGVTVTE